MESIYNEGILTIKLCGRIDSNNAAETEKEIFDLIEANGAKSVVLDAENTEYISSAGLRIILKLKKTTDNSKVINASPEVYEIFEMTGFSEIIDVEKALREISVDGCEKIGEGGFGIVYRLDDETIVKIYKAVGTDTIKREMNYAKQAFIKGIPTAISYDMVKCGDRYGAVFELIKSDTLANAIMKEPERLDEYVKKYTELVKIVQSTDVSDIISVRANDLYRKEFEKVKDYLTETEYGELTRLLRAIPDRNTMVHGDLHARNVMVQDGELMLIDMDEIMCGHPIYDLCNLYFAYKVLPGQRGADYTAKYFGMSMEMCEKFIKKFGEIYFSGLTSGQFKTMTDGMEIFAQMRYAYARLIHINATSSEHGIPRETLLEGAAQVLREAMLPGVDAAVKTLEFI